MRRALLVLLFVPLLLSSRTPASTLYACASMSRLQAECCCPHEALERGQAGVSRGCCCELVTLASAPPSASLRSEAPSPTQHVVVRWLEPIRLDRPYLLARVSAATGAARFRTVESRAGPSVVILHRRLLI